MTFQSLLQVSLPFQSCSIQILGENVPEPVENFLTCGLGPIITENVKLANYTVPTPGWFLKVLIALI